MEYIVDLEYKLISKKKNDYINFNTKDDIILKRLHLCRPIFSTKLINSVCFYFIINFELKFFFFKYYIKHKKN